MAFFSYLYTHTQVANNAPETSVFAIGDFTGFDPSKNIIFRSLVANSSTNGTAQISLSPITTGGTLCFYDTFIINGNLNYWETPVVASSSFNNVLFSTSFPTGTVITFKIDYQIVDNTNPFLNYYGSNFETLTVSSGFVITEVLGTLSVPRIPKNILCNAGAATKVNFYIGGSTSNCTLISSLTPSSTGVLNTINTIGLIATGQKLFIGIASPNPTETVSVVVNSSVLN
jgi:hypothetical protein